MSRTGSVPNRARRHTVTTVMRARELHAAGWGNKDVRRLLEREMGVTVAQSTMSRWLVPEQMEAARKRWAKYNGQRAAKRSARLGHPHARPEMKLTRMQALKDAGLSLADVARVMRLDFGDSFTRLQVERALRDGRYPGTFVSEANQGRAA